MCKIYTQLLRNICNNCTSLTFIPRNPSMSHRARRFIASHIHPNHPHPSAPHTSPIHTISAKKT